MSTNVATAEPQATRSVSRYVVGRLLGKGGAAVVHEAVDTLTGNSVALKRLHFGVKGTDRARHIELFKQEFFTLSELAHPHVVSVYDFGVDEEGPYYTMELLDGGDLLDNAPCDWRTACALARDVCSALTLIHSRRLVFRDLSPRNVRCTSGGTAKLLDFGALAPMGRAKAFVGTPAISAPEAVHFQALDARADLYSLGATFYHALTGRRPYPASSLAQLHDLWQRPFPPPSEVVAGIPPALDALVTDLLQLDRSLRPASAAEVMDRLTAIAGLERQEHSSRISSAFLSSPGLVGRDTSLARFRRSTEKIVAGGGAWLVLGARGVGRTRFLDACVLEGKLCGLVVLRADASESANGDHGVARALAAQLLESLPDEARRSAAARHGALTNLVPGLADPSDAGVRGPESSRQTLLAPALRNWMLAVAAERPLMIAIDDIHRIDAPSASFAALLAREAPRHPIVLVATLPEDDTAWRSSALRLLADESRAVRLGPLSEPRCERLLRSLFGDVPNVHVAAHRLHAVSKGLPRDFMQLAQHLVDRGVIRYHAGTWMLPARFDAGDLPAEMAHARRDKKKSLGADALQLARAFALGPDARYGFEECVALSEHGDGARVMASLDELVRAEIASPSANDYSLADPSWREPLVEDLEPGAMRAIYTRLALLFERRTTERFRAAEYWICAGEEERGLDRLVAVADASMQETMTSMEAFARLVQSLPENWLELYDKGLELCEKYRRPESDAMALYSRIIGVASQLPFDAAPYARPVVTRLARDTGLDVYESADPSLPPQVRLQKSLGVAAERHARGESLLDPKSAIHLLGRIVASSTGNAASTHSAEIVKFLPSLLPFAGISIALASWQTLVDGVRARVLGLNDQAREIYVRQLRRLAEPDRAGLDDAYQKAQVLGIELGLGIIEAAMGLRSSLDRAAALEASPLHEVNAVRVRMLHHLWQSNTAEADKCRELAELMIVERARRQTNEGAHLVRELLAHALSDDLTRVKRTLEAIEPFSAKCRGWKSVLHWAKAEYERIRGDNLAALTHVETALELMAPDGHQIWAETAGAHVRILMALERWDEAASCGALYLATADRRGVGYERNYILMPLSVALAHLGKRDEAFQAVDAVFEKFSALGSTGLNLGLAYETRARVCQKLGDANGFKEYAALCATHYRTRAGGPLAAKHERLTRDGVRFTPVDDAPIDADDRVMRTFHDCADPGQRVRQVLDLLLQSSGATGGFLFGIEDGEPVLRAHVADRALPRNIDDTARSYLLQECRGDEVTVLTDQEDFAVKSEWTSDGHEVYRPVLLNHTDDGSVVITGLVLLIAEPGKPYRSPTAMATSLSRLAMDQTGAVIVMD